MKIALAAFIAVASPQIHVLEGTKNEVHRVCKKASEYKGRATILACAIPMKSRCLIIIPRGASRNGWLFKHEVRHCHGWRH